MPKWSPTANSPQAIVDLTLAAENNGARDMKLLYELTVAEMDVAVARFNVTLSLMSALGHKRTLPGPIAMSPLTSEGGH